MLTIDRLRLTLPAGFAPRAGEIVRRVADELARAPLPGGPAGGAARFDHLSLPPVEPAPGATDAGIAAAVAAALTAALSTEPRGSGGTRP